MFFCAIRAVVPMPATVRFLLHKRFHGIFFHAFKSMLLLCNQRIAADSGFLFLLSGRNSPVSVCCFRASGVKLPFAGMPFALSTPRAERTPDGSLETGRFSFYALCANGLLHFERVNRETDTWHGGS